MGLTKSDTDSTPLQIGDGVKPGLWTLDWTMDWTMDWNMDWNFGQVA